MLLLPFGSLARVGCLHPIIVQFVKFCWSSSKCNLIVFTTAGCFIVVAFNLVARSRAQNVAMGESKRVRLSPLKFSALWNFVFFAQSFVHGLVIACAQASTLIILALCIARN